MIDVRANGGADSISPVDFDKFEQLLSTSGMTWVHEARGTSNEHYHVRLLGSKG